MFTLNILLRHQPTPFVLYFKTLDAADRGYESLKTAGHEALELRDEYGQRLTVMVEDTYGFFITEPEQMGEVQINLSLIQARAQASAQMRASQDPGMRASAMLGNGQRGFQ